MRRGRGALAAALALACALLGAAGCGGSAAGEDSETLKATYASFPDYLDPQLSYTLEGWTAMYDTYIPLLTYAHASGAAGSRIVPGLARGLPRVSDGGRTYTLALRRGLRYSDGTPVRASDFEATIKRLFLLNSGGSPFYTDIVGAERFARARQGGIAGIRADDRSGRIVIHLVKPRGTFSSELAMPFAAPLPPGTPAEDLSAEPPPATGPYEIVSSHPGSGWSYLRNPEWARANGPRVRTVPSGHFRAIDVAVIRNGQTRVHEVEAGRVGWTQSSPPADLYARVKAKYEGTQFRPERTVSTYYFWMNTERPPFDSLAVRRAVNYAVDPAALERIYAGSLAVSHQILPVGMPGHRAFDLYPHDLAKAKRLMARADPADRDVTVWTDNESPNNEAAAYYQEVLSRLGFQARLKEVNADNYFGLVGNVNTPELDTGWGDWFEDYPHPSDFLQPQLTGESISPVGNNNLARLDLPRLDARVSRLGREQLGPRQEAAYARLDREYMRQAPWVPYGSNTTSTFVSSAIDLDKVVYNPTFGDDLTSFRPR